MKILILTPYIYFDSNSKVSRNRTGFGLMVNDIATSFKESGHVVFLLTNTFFTKGEEIDGLKFLPRRQGSLFPFFYFQVIKSCFKYFKQEGAVVSLKHLIYFASINNTRKQIRNVNPDIIHIHGLGVNTIPFIIACIKEGRKFVITLHGLDSFNSSVGVNIRARKYEKNFLKLVLSKSIEITVISSGIKKRIFNFLKVSSIDNLSVVTNGTSFNNNMVIKSSLINSYNFRKEDKLLLCIGNLCKRKNQKQVLRVFSKVQADYSNLKLVIIGKNNPSYNIDIEVSNLKIEDKTIITGPVSREEITAFLDKANFNITASIDEGFGLPIIEAFAFGLPTTCFSDIDAVPDLFNTNTMILAQERSDESLENALRKMLDKNWDKEIIKKHSQQFSSSKMAKNYIQIFKSSKENDLKLSDIMNILK